MSLSVEQLSNATVFPHLRSEWTALLARTANREIALTWEWLFTWWSVFGEGTRRLLLLMLRDPADSRLVGLAPLQCRLVTLSPLLPRVRRVEFLASGEDDRDAICSDYLNVIAESGREFEVASNVVAYLCADLAPSWDELHLEAMDAAAPSTVAMLQALREQGLRVVQHQHATCPYLRLPVSWEVLIAGLDRRTRAELRRSERRLADLGRVEFRRTQSSTELENDFSTLVDLHRRRHAAKGNRGAFESSSFTEFHQRLLPLALENGWLDLRTLVLNERPIAARYCFRHAGRVLYYQGGMDLAAMPGGSLGLLMDAHCIREAVSDGLHEYDFMRGAEAYKDRWASAERQLVTLQVDMGRPRAVAFARRVKRGLSGLRKKLPSWLRSRDGAGHEQA